MTVPFPLKFYKHCLCILFHVLVEAETERTKQEIHRLLGFYNEIDEHQTSLSVCDNFIKTIMVLSIQNFRLKTAPHQEILNTSLLTKRLRFQIPQHTTTPTTMDPVQQAT